MLRKYIAKGGSRISDNGNWKYAPFGCYTVPARKSNDLAEAHRQTRNGELKAQGKEMLPLPKENTTRPEYPQERKNEQA